MPLWRKAKLLLRRQANLPLRKLAASEAGAKLGGRRAEALGGGLWAELLVVLLCGPVLPLRKRGSNIPMLVPSVPVLHLHGRRAVLQLRECLLLVPAMPPTVLLLCGRG